MIPTRYSNSLVENKLGVILCLRCSLDNNDYKRVINACTSLVQICTICSICHLIKLKSSKTTRLSLHSRISDILDLHTTICIRNSVCVIGNLVNTQ